MEDGSKLGARLVVILIVIIVRHLAAWLLPAVYKELRQIADLHHDQIYIFPLHKAPSVNSDSGLEELGLRFATPCSTVAARVSIFCYWSMTVD